MARKKHIVTKLSLVRNALRLVKRVLVLKNMQAHHLFTRATQKAHIAHKGKEIVMMVKKMKFRFASLAMSAVAVAIATLLAACGGGGGETSPSPVVVTPPVAVEVKMTLNSSTPSAVAAGATTTPATLTWATTQGTPVNAKVVSSTGATVGTGASGSTVVQVPVGTSTFSVMDDSGTKATVSVTVSCATGTTLVAGVCTLPVSYWPRETYTAINVKVFSPSMVGTAVRNIGDDGWKKAVMDGTVKFTDTGLVLEGFSSRALKQAFYSTPSGGWCTRLVFADDGSAVGHAGIDSGCNTDRIEWTMGTATGLLRFYPAVGKCYALGWDKTAQVYTETQVTCP